MCSENEYQEQVLERLQEFKSKIFDIQDENKSGSGSDPKEYLLDYPCFRFKSFLVLAISIFPISTSQENSSLIKAMDKLSVIQSNNHGQGSFKDNTRNFYATVTPSNSSFASTASNATSSVQDDIFSIVTVESLILCLKKVPMKVKAICAFYPYDFIATSKVVNELLSLFQDILFQVNVSEKVWSLKKQMQGDPFAKSPFSEMLRELKALLAKHVELKSDDIFCLMLNLKIMGWTRMDMKRVLYRYNGSIFTMKNDVWKLNRVASNAL